MKFIAKLIIYAISAVLAALLLPGIQINGIASLIILAAVLIFLKAVIKPILTILTLPINLMTLGLFTFVINAFLILLTDLIVPGFTVDNFFWALIFSFLLSIFVWVFEKFDKEDNKKKKK